MDFSFFMVIVNNTKHVTKSSLRTFRYANIVIIFNNAIPTLPQVCNLWYLYSIN